MILSVILILALFLKVTPIFVVKHNLDVFATEICRTAEINGCIGTATKQKTDKLKIQTGLNPTISWSKTGNIQINQEFTVELTTTYNIGFGPFRPFPVTLRSRAVGTSEVYHK